MNGLSQKLLKNGIQALLEKEENYFKKNIVQTLSIKLNTAISGILSETNKNLFLKYEPLENSKDLEYFLNIIENKDKVQLKDGSIINITENDSKSLKRLFDNLNTDSRKKMISSIFKSSNNFKQHIDFYNTAKGIFR
jgi:hypothetical protein